VLAAAVALALPGLVLAQAAKKAARIVHLSGLSADAANPGITLFRACMRELGYELALLKEALPRLSKLAVFWRPEHAGHRLSLDDLKAAAPALGITILPLQVKTAADIDQAFATIRNERAGGLMLLGDALLTTHMKRIADLAIEYRVPAMYTARVFIHAGGFMGYGANIPEMYRRAATYVDKILKGAKPGDIPIEQPTDFELTFNLKTAKALEIAVPHSLLARADEVIQ
jgi:putative ABC transport system substrate-binding protein